MQTHSRLTLSQTQAARLVNKAKFVDGSFLWLGRVILLGTLLVLATLILDFVIDGLPRIDWAFMTNFPSRNAGSAGILSSWVGSALVMFVTAWLAVPLGVAAGVYLEEYAPNNWFTNLIEINVNNLAGVPSIIYGLLALGLFVQSFQMGQTILVAGITLALLILPIIIVSTRESIRAIPRELREASYGLGADQWQTIRMFILPAARPGILTGMIVGLSRAIGETAPLITIGALTFIAFLPPAPVAIEHGLWFNFPSVNLDWINSPFTALPIQMFNWISRPQAAFHVNAAATGVILLGLTLLMNGAAIYIRYKLRKNMK